MAIQFNLLPWRDELRFAREKNTKIVLGIGAVCGLIAVVGFYYYCDLKLEDNARAKSYYESKILGLAKAKKEKDDLEKSKKMVLEQIDSIEKLRGRRVITTEILKQVSESSPENLFLRDISLDKNRFVMKGIAVNEEEMTKMTRSLESSSIFGIGTPSYSQGKNKKDSIKEFTYTTKITDNKKIIKGGKNGKK